MIHSVRFTCVLDTNVIYPVNIRDLLLWFAHYDLFTVKWSNGICEEWIKVMREKGIDEPEIAQTHPTDERCLPRCAWWRTTMVLIEGLAVTRQGRPPCAGRRDQGQRQPDRHE
jgi:hypothetical protein